MLTSWKIVNSLPFACGFSQIGFPRKNRVFTCFVCVNLCVILIPRDAKPTAQSIASENLHHILVLSLRSESLHSRSLPNNFPQKSSSRSTMAPRKWIANDATSKGKAIATIWSKASYQPVINRVPRTLAPSHHKNLTPVSNRWRNTAPITNVKGTKPSIVGPSEGTWKSSSNKAFLKSTFSLPRQFPEHNLLESRTWSPSTRWSTNYPNFISYRVYFLLILALCIAFFR